MGYEEHVLDHTTRYLARDLSAWTSDTPRHAYLGRTGPGLSSGVSDAWRFPIVEPHGDLGLTADERLRWNEVTFLYVGEADALPDAHPEVIVLGLPFEGLREVRLLPVGDSRFLAATVLLPVGRVYRYALRIGGMPQPDPINPQRRALANGEMLSEFFTDYCSTPLTFESWERMLLRRLVECVLPFQSSEQEQFERQPGGEPEDFPRLGLQEHVLDQSVGAVNFIDKLLARMERHRLADYRSCLLEIDRVLRQRFVYGDPGDAPKAFYTTLYAEMASNAVPGWNRAAYDSPAFFLRLFRRHVWTGSFAHPRYGGNGGWDTHSSSSDRGADGWRWLAERYPFAWEKALPAPLGTSTEYRG
jgi:hypothetical protein